MENTDSHIMANDVAKTIGTMTEQTNSALNQGATPAMNDVQPIDLLEFQESFRELGVEVLPDSLAESKLAELKNQLYKLKTRFPEGTHVLLAAFPCDANGRLYSDEELKNHDYFKTLFVDEKTGLSSGFGSWTNGFSKLLPKEIQDQCSFTVHYSSIMPYSDDKDFEQFSSEYKKAFHALKALLS